MLPWPISTHLSTHVSTQKACSVLYFIGSPQYTNMIRSIIMFLWLLISLWAPIDAPGRWSISFLQGHFYSGCLHSFLHVVFLTMNSICTEWTSDQDRRRLWVQCSPLVNLQNRKGQHPGRDCHKPCCSFTSQRSSGLPPWGTEAHFRSSMLRWLLFLVISCVSISKKDLHGAIFILFFAWAL